jgi:isopropylmalate/isohomocitrate dehydrogenase-like protein
MAKKTHYTICTIGGDGIGPEVVGETVKLLKKLPISFDFVRADAGFGAYQKWDTPLPEKTITLCKNADAVLFGAVTSPPNIQNYFSPIVRLRKLLDTYANVRPFSSLPLADFRQNIDIVIVRENTEDVYAGHERLTADGAITERIITRKACVRIVRYAFELAIKQKRKKVTAVHKANVMRLTDGLFLQIAQDVSKQYPQIQFEDMLVDACAMQLVIKPEAFDVIVTTNMFGDILSDEIAALTGGLGIAASANIGDKYALFEPVHGSAPKYAGKNRANPMACFLAACLMLEYLGEETQSQRVRKAILKTIKRGIRTVDLHGKNSMSEFTEGVIVNL